MTYIVPVYFILFYLYLFSVVCGFSRKSQESSSSVHISKSMKLFQEEQNADISSAPILFDKVYKPRGHRPRMVSAEDSALSPLSLEQSERVERAIGTSEDVVCYTSSNRVDFKTYASPIVLIGKLENTVNYMDTTYTVDIEIIQVIKGNGSLIINGYSPLRSDLAGATLSIDLKHSLCIEPIPFQGVKGAKYVFFLDWYWREPGNPATLTHFLYTYPEPFVKREVKKILKKMLCKDCKIRTPRVSSLSDRRVQVGNQLRLDCRGKGNPNPIILWHKDGTPLVDSNDGRISVFFSEIKVLTVSIKPILAEDQGIYTCMASNTVDPPTSTQMSLVVTDTTSALENTTIVTTTRYADCPSPMYDKYCLNKGECFFISEINTPACRCTEWFIGPRCQYITSPISSRKTGNLCLPSDPTKLQIDYAYVVVAITASIALLLLLTALFTMYITRQRQRMKYLSSQLREFDIDSPVLRRNTTNVPLSEMSELQLNQLLGNGGVKPYSGLQQGRSALFRYHRLALMQEGNSLASTTRLPHRTFHSGRAPPTTTSRRQFKELSPARNHNNNNNLSFKKGLRKRKRQRFHSQGDTDGEEDCYVVLRQPSPYKLQSTASTWIPLHASANANKTANIDLGMNAGPSLVSSSSEINPMRPRNTHATMSNSSPDVIARTTHSQPEDIDPVILRNPNRQNTQNVVPQRSSLVLLPENFPEKLQGKETDILDSDTSSFTESLDSLIIFVSQNQNSKFHKSGWRHYSVDGPLAHPINRCTKTNAPVNNVLINTSHIDTSVPSHSRIITPRQITEHKSIDIKKKTPLASEESGLNEDLENEDIQNVAEKSQEENYFPLAGKTSGEYSKSSLSQGTSLRGSLRRPPLPKHLIEQNRLHASQEDTNHVSNSLRIQSIT